LIGYSAAPQISRRRFDELYDLRLLLEPEAARRAALTMDDTRLATLRKVAGVMSRKQEGDERLRYSAFARQDAVFHDRILEFAGNELIRNTLAHQHAHFHIFRLMFHSRVTEEALDEHQALLSAFAAGDGRAAKRAMRDHIGRSRDRLLPAFE
jgi:DNA-binding GntR family transcriptional regulator